MINETELPPGGPKSINGAFVALDENNNVQVAIARDQISGRQIIPAWVKQLQSIDGVHNDSHEDIYREMIDGTSARAKELISEFNNRFVTTSEAENAALRAMIGVQAVIKWANDPLIGGEPSTAILERGKKKWVWFYRPDFSPKLKS